MDINDISFECKRGAKLPYDKRDEWQKDANDYRITLRYKGQKMQLDFFTGKGWTRDPELKDVMENLFSDSWSENTTFEDFCNEIGWDTDSRRAHKAWKATIRQCVKLRRLLGSDMDAMRAAFWEQLNNPNQ